MANCKDCICEKVCRYNDGVNSYCKGVFGCPYFKDRSKVIELPCKTCKIGDTIYTIYSDEDGSLIEELTVSEVSTQRIWADYGCSFHYDDLGKTVFLTPEEAEKALEEHNA